MRIIKDPREKLNTKTVVALGCFDGVHMGHARVIGEAVRIARELEVASAVWCFSEPPKNFYLKEPVALICDSTEKARLIRMLGTDILTEPDFTREISLISARDFVSELLCKCSGAIHLVCGGNYTFGAGCEGNVKLLGELCRELSVGLSVVGDVSVDGVNVSSTLVRDAVSNGQCVYAKRLLGRNFSLCFDASEEDEDILWKGSSVFKVNKKYLYPRAGDYELEVCYGGYKKKCNGRIIECDGEAKLVLDRHVDRSDRVRVEFSTKIFQ